MATFYGTNYNDDLTGYSSDDVMYGYDGADVLDGGYGHDDLYGGYGNDWLYGDYGDDWLYGEAGNDDLYGEAGHDDLYGGAGADDLYGGSGNDWLSGGTGSDYLWGGTGYDAFFFSQGTSGITTATADVIQDWNGAYDDVDMTLIGTSTNYREAATNVTSIADAAAAAEAVYTSTSISHVFLYNSSTDTGYLLSDLNNDDRFETGVVMKNAGFASDLNYNYII